MLRLGRCTFSSSEPATEKAYAPSNTHDSRRSWTKTDNTSERALDVPTTLLPNPQEQAWRASSTNLLAKRQHKSVCTYATTWAWNNTCDNLRGPAPTRTCLRPRPKITNNLATRPLHDRLRERLLRDKHHSSMCRSHRTSDRRSSLIVTLMALAALSIISTDRDRCECFLPPRNLLDSLALNPSSLPSISTQADSDVVEADADAGP